MIKYIPQVHYWKMTYKDSFIGNCYYTGLYNQPISSYMGTEQWEYVASKLTWRGDEYILDKALCTNWTIGKDNYVCDLTSVLKFYEDKPRFACNYVAYPQKLNGKNYLQATKYINILDLVEIKFGILDFCTRYLMELREVRKLISHMSSDKIHQFIRTLDRNTYINTLLRETADSLLYDLNDVSYKRSNRFSPSTAYKYTQTNHMYESYNHTILKYLFILYLFLKVGGKSWEKALAEATDIYDYDRYKEAINSALKIVSKYENIAYTYITRLYNVLYADSIFENIYNVTETSREYIAIKDLYFYPGDMEVHNSNNGNGYQENTESLKTTIIDTLHTKIHISPYDISIGYYSYSDLLHHITDSINEIMEDPFLYKVSFVLTLLTANSDTFNPNQSLGVANLGYHVTYSKENDDIPYINKDLCMHTHSTLKKIYFNVLTNSPNTFRGFSANGMTLVSREGMCYESATTYKVARQLVKNVLWEESGNV